MRGLNKKNHSQELIEGEKERESDQHQGNAIQKNKKESKVKKTHPNEMNGALQFAFDLKLSQKPAFCSVNIYIKRSSFVNFIYGPECQTKTMAHIFFSLSLPLSLTLFLHLS